MILPDVNILVNAFREDGVDHVRHRAFLDDLINGDEPFGMVSIVLSGFLRTVTHPRVFPMPTPLDAALEFTEKLTSSQACLMVNPGPRHWDIFVSLCRAADARGNLVPDAYLAALAIESGSEWITSDGDFARFPGLRWRRPY